MSLKPLALYQGGDWFTHRWPVAQAYDTLDRLHDLCLFRSWEKEAVPTSEVIEVLHGVLALCDDLLAELTAAEADLLPVYTATTAPQRWLAFETRLYRNEIQKRASVVPSFEPSSLFEEILFFVGQIKNTLKKLDQ